MKKSLWMLMLTLTMFAGAAFLVGCGNTTEENTIRMAGVGPLSGDAAIYGVSVKNGIQIAVDEINASEEGVQIEDKDGNATKYTIDFFDFKNDEATPDRAAAAFNALYDKGLDFMIGAVTSGATEGLIGESIKQNVPTLTATGTAAALTGTGDADARAERSNTFRACFIDPYQGQMMAKFAIEQGYENVAVLYNTESDYSVGLFEAFKAYGEANGLTSVDGKGYQNATSAFDSYFSEVNNSAYDALFVPDYYEKVVKIVTTARAQGFTNACLGCDGWDGVLGVDGVNNAGDDNTSVDFEGCYFSNHFAADSTSAKVQDFVAKYEAAYNEAPTVFAALAYDAVYIMKQAYEDCDSLEYQDVIDAMSASDFVADCVTGQISFDEYGNPKKDVFVMGFDVDEDTNTASLKFKETVSE